MPQMMRKALTASTETLADKRQVKVRISTDQVDRTGDIMVQGGIDVSSFMQTRAVLWNHNQDCPIAACVSLSSGDGGLDALVQFPPEGVSSKADEVYGLIGCGVINAASIGFLPVDAEPVDGKNPKKGLKIITSDLLEFSFVSVPANPGAIIMERAMPAAKTKTVAKFNAKSLYAVGQLASLLGQLGWLEDDVAWEAEYEGDGSPVPAMLADALRQLGEALIAMTIEEVTELLGDEAGESTKAAKATITKAFGLVAGNLGVTKAGRTFSAASTKSMQDACKSILEGHDQVKALLEAEAPDKAEEKSALASITAAAKALDEDASQEHDARRRRTKAFELAGVN